VPRNAILATEVGMSETAPELETAPERETAPVPEIVAPGPDPAVRAVPTGSATGVRPDPAAAIAASAATVDIAEAAHDRAAVEVRLAGEAAAILVAAMAAGEVMAVAATAVAAVASAAEADDDGKEGNYEHEE